MSEAGRKRWRLSTAAWLGLLAGTLIGVGFAQDPLRKNRDANEDGEVNGIFVPADHEARQRLSRAQKAADEQRYADAVVELKGMLAFNAVDDVFLGKPGADDAQTSLKTQALRILGGLPQPGREAYERELGAQARAELKTAIRDGNLEAIGDVSRRFFHTQAGYEATLLLGRVLLDQGQPLAAALAFKRVWDLEPVRGRYEPELSILLATSCLHARQLEQAADVLKSLRQRQPAAKIRFGEREVALFTRDDEAVAWLGGLVGAASESRRDAAPSEWVMFRGNESRTAASAGGLPLVHLLWKTDKNTRVSPQDAERISRLSKGRQDREGLVPSLQPLIVGDYVVFRTAERVYGVTLHTPAGNPSGACRWFYPYDDGEEIGDDPTPQPPGQRPGAANVSSRDSRLQQRLWEDQAYGQMSSDGELVFFLSELPYETRPAAASRRGPFGPNGFIRGGKRETSLCAISLHREGALVWEIKTKAAEDPNLAGGVFLGPPLPLGGKLYALAEFNSEIRLLCLNAKTGSLEWKQPIAAMQNWPIEVDAGRRLAGATPSYADGVLVCPTSGGGAVAVDLATRTLRWGYQYPRADTGLGMDQMMFGMRPARGDGSQPVGHWVDGAVTIAGGGVLLTPVESDKLHCLDLITGKARWPAQPRGELLFVGCVYQNKAVLVGKNLVKAINLATGEAAWKQVVDLEGETPLGRGYSDSRFYYLPVSPAQLWKIDLETGDVATKMKTEIPLGNLVAAGEQLISQGPEFTAAFYLAEPLRLKVEQRLAKNADDVWALTHRGEILLQQGQPASALDSLRKAQRLQPNNQTARESLCRAIVTLLRQDYAQYQHLAPEAETLLDEDPQLKRDFYRLRASGLQKSGQPKEAFHALLTLSEQVVDPADNSPEMVESGWYVNRNRWIQGQLAALFKAADETTRKELAASLQVRLPAAIKSRGVGPLRDFVEQFHFHPISRPAQLELARRLHAAGAELEAELLTGELAIANDPASAGPAWAILARIYSQSGRADLALDCFARLETEFAQIQCEGAKSGRECVAEARQQSPASLEKNAARWGSGQLEFSQPEKPVSEEYARQQIIMAGFYGVAARETRCTYLSREETVLVRNGLGQIVSRLQTPRVGANERSPYSAFAEIRPVAKMNGNLIVLCVHNELLALNGLESGAAGKESEPPAGAAEPLLWRQSLLDRPESSKVAPLRPSANPLTQGSRLASGDSRSPIQLQFGAVTAQGVYFQRGRGLQCVSPLTGATIWERPLAEGVCELFGDEEVVVVVPSGADTAQIYSAIDGALLDRRKIDRAENRWAVCGRRVLAWELAEDKDEPEVRLRLYDAARQGTGLWSRQVARGAKGCLIQNEELALLEPNGQLTVVSLRDGRQLWTQRLAPEAALEHLVVLRSATRYLVFVCTPGSDAPPNTNYQPVNLAGIRSMLIHGRVYACERANGRLQWQTPAYLGGHGLWLDQPVDSPLLVFVRQTARMRTASAVQTDHALFCLDQRDGSLAYSNDSFTDQLTHCDLTADPGRQTVFISLNGQSKTKSLLVTFTDKPAPPAPPAQTGAEASAAAHLPPGESADVSEGLFRLGRPRGP